MKRIIVLLLVCVLAHINGHAQSPALIAHYLGEAKKLTSTTDDLKPLVVVDDTPYVGSIENFKAKELTSIRIFDPITAHALFQRAGVHGAIVMTTKYRRSIPVDDNSQTKENGRVVNSKRLFGSKRSLNSKPTANIGTSSASAGNDQLDNILAKLGPGYKSFITYHKGNNNITYMFNGLPMRGSRSAIALTMSGIPRSNIKFVKTKKITNSHGLGAIVYIRTIK
jgi:hypothetical protein